MIDPIEPRQGKTGNDREKGDIQIYAMLEDFEHTYAQAIKSKIEKDGRYSALRDTITAQSDINDTDRENIDSTLINLIIFEREMAFCRHMLTRLTRILQRQEALAAEPETTTDDFIFQINTSILYDIDNTLYSMETIRPSGSILLGYIRNKLAVRIGLCTRRESESVNKQLDNPDAAGSLYEVADYIDRSLIKTIETQGILGDVRPDTFDYSLYPGYDQCDTSEVIRRAAGWTADELENFLRDVFPELLFEYLRNLELKRIMYGKRYYRDSDAPVMSFEEARAEFERDTEKVQDLRRDAESILQDPRSIQNYLENIFVYNRFTPTEDSVLPQPIKNFQEAVKQLHENIYHNNALAKNVVLDQLSQAFGVNVESEINFDVLLMRISKARDVLRENPDIKVSIVVDDDHLADMFDKLFFGELTGSDDQPLDGYELFGLEDFRERLYLISCGERGRFSSDDINKDVIIAAQAA